MELLVLMAFTIVLMVNGVCILPVLSANLETCCTFGFRKKKRQTFT